MLVFVLIPLLPRVMYGSPPLEVALVEDVGVSFDLLGPPLEVALFLAVGKGNDCLVVEWVQFFAIEWLGW